MEVYAKQFLSSELYMAAREKMVEEKKGVLKDIEALVSSGRNDI